MSEEPAGAPVYRPVAELFTRPVSALWATTYNVDLALVNEFLLPRLGQPPLNLTVLADHRTLGRTLARIPADRTDTLAAVNRRWLLRGARGHGPSFHPKSYLAVTSARATLMVGSGNLSLRGLDEGREVFTAFRSGTPGGDRAIALWRNWMRQLVRDLDDPVVSERFGDLERRLPSPVAVPADPAAPRLAHDLDVPLLDQLADAVGDTAVDELVVAAPFHDPGATALATLVQRFAPRRTVVYVAATTSVDGPALRRAVAGTDARFRMLDPDRFTHAKLVGVVQGDRGWLLSGSANVSRAGLLTPARDRGNVELGVLASLPADVLRGCFVPPGVAVAECDPDLVDALTADPDDEDASSRPVRLVRAEALDDGRVVVVSDPRPEQSWSLVDRIGTYSLGTGADGRVVTGEPVASRLVRLADREGSPISDAVVVDDPVALAAQLCDGGDAGRRSAPLELTDGDLDSDLGQALLQLHRELVMDAAELADGPTVGGVPDGSGAPGDDDFWDRLLREQLAADPRASRYPGLAGPGRHPGELDDLLEKLRLRLRPELGPRHRSGSDERPDGDPSPELGVRWSPRARLRIRARNVLRRWVSAVADPRLAWVDPAAPEGNFTVLANVLGQLRLAAAERPYAVELTAHDVDELWWSLLATFCGTGRRDGYLDRFARAEADARVGGLDRQVRETAAWMCWLGVRPGAGWRTRVVRHQAALASAVERNLPQLTENAARHAATARGDDPIPAPTPAGMTDGLLRAATFIDDDLWCEVMADQLGLAELRFVRMRDPSRIRTELHVHGLDDPLQDPRVPRLLLAADRYRGRAGVVLRAAPASGGRRNEGLAPGGDWRLAHEPEHPIGYSASRSHDMVDSLVGLDSGRLERMSEAGQSLATIFDAFG
ncbi:hypothetical protein [Pseudonocardia endophytica]|uniref:Uncharacterized protein n=1 Tax=Pseudonocardia endophytica TaxID=401976 RepID=A0A4R1HLG5_PSEEN|nr:hypothetical protein [Pseudonocardia endophytica]TCK21941.1 hypothetical protein EV378_5938 [Pseudonocardia endophytica]